MKSKRDYLRKGSHFSWLYLSRLAALKEYAFMKALGDHGLPVPKVGCCCSCRHLSRWRHQHIGRRRGTLVQALCWVGPVPTLQP